MPDKKNCMNSKSITDAARAATAALLEDKGVITADTNTIIRDEKQLEVWVKKLMNVFKEKNFIVDAITYSEPSKKDIEFADILYRIYTEYNEYDIAYKENKNRKSYLGCTAHNRYPYEEETWTRGCDLADGEFNENTWGLIKVAMINEEIETIEDLQQYNVKFDKTILPKEIKGEMVLYRRTRE